MLEESDCQGGHAENGSIHSSPTMGPARPEIAELLPQEGLRDHERRSYRVERMITRIKEWLSEFRPHLVTDGELWAVRRRAFGRFGQFEYASRISSHWWGAASAGEFCFVDRETAVNLFKAMTRIGNLRKVDPNNPVRLVEGGEE